MAYKTITLNEEKQQQLANILAELKDTNGDPEGVHSAADCCLCEALAILGYGELADAWNEAKEVVGFWYA